MTLDMSKAQRLAEEIARYEALAAAQRGEILMTEELARFHNALRIRYFSESGEVAQRVPDAERALTCPVCGALALLVWLTPRVVADEFRHRCASLACRHEFTITAVEYRREERTA